jgi:hypothetical protein
MGKERGGFTIHPRSRADDKGVLAGVPFFDEIFAYAGCS